MKRYYLSKIEQYQDPGIGLVYRHRMQVLQQELGMNFEYEGGEIATDPITGAPLHKALLVLVGGIDHKQFQDDAGLIPMPVVAHDTKVSAIHTATKVKARAAIKALGYSDAEVEAAWGNADGLRDVLNHYGKKNNANFDCDKFDLDES